MKPGFIMLVTLTALGMVTAFIMHVWFMTSLQQDIVHERSIWRINEHRARNVLNAAITHCTHHSVHNPIVLDMSRKTDRYTQYGRIEPIGDGRFLVHATVCDNAKILCAVRCLAAKRQAVVSGIKKVQCDVWAYTVD